MATAAKRILVADDNGAIRALLRLHLVNAGYEVDLAEDAVEAGKLLYRSRPDLLIIDVEMPYMNGLEFVAMLKADPSAPHVPILLITAHEGFAERAQSLGIDCLMKPFFADELLKRVEKTITAKA